MNKRDRRTLVNNLIKDTKEFILFFSLIAVTLSIAFAINSLATNNVAEQEETVADMHEAKELFYDLCMQRPCKANIKWQHYNCLKEAQRKFETYLEIGE